MVQINGQLSLLDALAIFQLWQLVNKWVFHPVRGGWLCKQGWPLLPDWEQSLHVDITRVPMELSVTVIISDKVLMGMAKLSQSVHSP